MTVKTKYFKFTTLKKQRIQERENEIQRGEKMSKESQGQPRGVNKDQTTLNNLNAHKI